MKNLNSIICLGIVYIICVSIIIACGDSPTENQPLDDSNEKKQPSLENMVLITAGEFLMGSKEGEGAFDEHPQNVVYLDAYYIDKYEVTNAQFKEFVDMTGYVTTAERMGGGWVWNPVTGSTYASVWFSYFSGVNWQRPYAWRKNIRYPKAWDAQIADKMDHPVVQVSWSDAKAYAEWAGKRLPTEAEWEKAAGGVDGLKWPWGNEFDSEIANVTTYANVHSECTTPIGQFPTGLSPYGVYDMAGNVLESVADWYSSDYYKHSPLKNPTGPDVGEFRVLRGGSWASRGISDNLRCAQRTYKPPDYVTNFIGFRCALDL